MRTVQGTLFGMAYIFQDRENITEKFKLGIRYSSDTYLGKMLCFNLGYYIFRFYSHNMKTPKQWYRLGMYRLALKLRRFEIRVIHWYNMNFNTKPIYYMISSTDCDLCESTSFGKSKNYKEHYLYLNDSDSWDWVEGRVSIDEISEDEYFQGLDMRIPLRDRVMEAYENGNGRNINV